MSIFALSKTTPRKEYKKFCPMGAPPLSGAGVSGRLPPWVFSGSLNFRHMEIFDRFLGGSESNVCATSSVSTAVDWIYDKVQDGAGDMARDYLRGTGSLEEKVNSLIRVQNTKAASSGFLSGLGGLTTSLVLLPANVTSVLYFQVQMVTAIAVMCGLDPKDDRVKALVLQCLACSSAADVLKAMGVEGGKRLTAALICKIPRAWLSAINRALGVKLVTKFSEKGAVVLGKGVPLVGGLIGGSVDAYTTNRIGNVARDLFVPVAS